MARYILNDKIYDTEKSEKVFSFRRIENANVLGIEYGYWVTADLCKTQNGNWFCVTSENKAYVYSESDVKRLLKELNQVDIYEEHFKKLEMA